MKQFILPIFIIYFCLLISNLSAQWIPKGKGILDSDYYITAISTVDENVVWTVANSESGKNRAKILLSKDAGETWIMKEVSIDSFIYSSVTDLTAVNDSMAWIGVLHGENTKKILKTTDGGATWEVQLSINNSKFAVSPTLEFLDENTGYYIDFASYTAGKTVDGGEEWTKNTLAIKAEAGLWGIACPTNWMVVLGDSLWFGMSNHTYRSFDGTLSWQFAQNGFSESHQITSLAMDEQGLGFAISRFSENPFAFSDSTFIQKTIDFGQSWEELPQLKFPLLSINKVPGASRTFIGVSGAFVGEGIATASAYTTDGGDTWTVIDQNIPYSIVEFISPKIGWAGSLSNFDYGERPVLFKWTGDFTTSTLEVETKN